MQRYGLENDQEEGELVIKKRDEDHGEIPLKGAEFEIKNMASGDIYKAVTNKAGEARVSGLPLSYINADGQERLCVYEIREVKAPEGYQLETSRWAIRLDQGQAGLVIYELTVKNRPIEEKPPEEPTPEETTPEATTPEDTTPEE